MSKAEERLEKILEKHENQIESRIISVWLWGFASGVVLSSTNLLAVTVGLSLGYVLSKKDFTPFKNLFMTVVKRI